jgi:hypothetical protein
MSNSFLASKKFANILGNIRLASIIIFFLSGLSILCSFVLGSPRIPGDFLFFQMGVMLFTVYFFYSSLQVNIQKSEKLFYGWISFLLITFIFGVNNYSGYKILILINIILLVFLIIMTFSKNHSTITFPNADSVLIFSVLLTSILFLMALPSFKAKYEAMERMHKMKQVQSR